ncbi:MAG: prephenate dehydrogenase/arogenate dehydrogenase family protein, partial [Actinomycetota bacterium]|nr:prephenate dehydrogenase/arogenate dehydrogenase family protein [Actinomycetota bacterium]
MTTAPTPPADVLVVGTGLVGTSVALALTAAGSRVFLADVDAANAEYAAALGAGSAAPPESRVDLCVLAVPPGAVAGTLRGLQERDAAAVYTDVASIKTRPHEEARQTGCDLRSYVGGHPMAGRERSGPAAARMDLFVGRPWVLTPSAESTTGAVAAVRALAHTCG